MDERRYYPCQVRFNRDTIFVAWYCNCLDGFLRDEDGRLVAAHKLGELTVAAQNYGVVFEDASVAAYDFDRKQEWCTAPNAAGVNCVTFLNAWNFLDDLSGLHGGVETTYTRISNAAEECYDLLFWGSNLPALTPPGERFDPKWTAEGLADIRGVMMAGLELLAAELAEK